VTEAREIPYQDRVASEAGEMLAALHGLDPEPLHPILGPPDWAGFLAGQRAKAGERQREVGLPGLWLSQIEGFLESAPLAPDRERVLLHSRPPPSPLWIPWP
jgi:hygromycin-B 7''-O-kinase